MFETFLNVTGALRSKITCVRFKLLMVVKIHIVFWVVTLCSLARGDQCFGRACASIFTSAVKMVVECFSDMLVPYENDLCHNAEDCFFMQL